MDPRFRGGDLRFDWQRFFKVEAHVAKGEFQNDITTIKNIDAGRA